MSLHVIAVQQSSKRCHCCPAKFKDFQSMQQFNFGSFRECSCCPAMFKAMPLHAIAVQQGSNMFKACNSSRLVHSGNAIAVQQCFRQCYDENSTMIACSCHWLNDATCLQTQIAQKHHQNSSNIFKIFQNHTKNISKIQKMNRI